MLRICGDQAVTWVEHPGPEDGMCAWHAWGGVKITGALKASRTYFGTGPWRKGKPTCAEYGAPLELFCVPTLIIGALEPTVYKKKLVKPKIYCSVTFTISGAVTIETVTIDMFPG